MENQAQIKKLPKLTKKQRGFVNDYVEIGIASEAVKKNYNVSTDLTARSIGSENLTKPNIINAIEVKQESLKNALIKQGITPDYLAEKVELLLTATDKAGNTDFTAVDKGLKHATNIYGIENLDDKPKSQTTYNFIFNSETQEKIKILNNEIKDKLINHENSQETK